MTRTTVHFLTGRTTVRFAQAAITSGVFIYLLNLYNASLPFCNSNEDALAGIDHDGNAITPLTVGMEYKAGSGHVAAPYGAKLSVTD